MKIAQVDGGIVVNVIEVEPAQIPDWAVGWPEAAEAGPGWTWNGSAFAPPTGLDPAEVLAATKAAARARLAETIARVRAAQITVLPGQDMIYLSKEAEARAWLAAEAPVLADYPLLSAEAGITAPDADQLAQLWLNLGTLWRQAAGPLEAARMAIGAAIDAAATVEEVDAAAAQITPIDG